MPGPSEIDSARLRRDLSLVLRRRLTVYAAVGATALTAGFALIAATTAPGTTSPAAEHESQPDAVPSSDPVVTQPALDPPFEAPQSGFGGQPTIVSGGS